MYHLKQNPPLDPLALAQAVGAAMWVRDRATNALGMQLLHIQPGDALLAMPVRGDMVNGHHICHGGLIFTLADSAFAYACNSDNQNTVASACHIDFLAPAHEGDTLQAHALERSRSGRTGVYDVTVSISKGSRSGTVVALFRGKSYRLSGQVIDGLQQTEPNAPTA